MWRWRWRILLGALKHMMKGLFLPVRVLSSLTLRTLQSFLSNLLLLLLHSFSALLSALELDRAAAVEVSTLRDTPRSAALLPSDNSCHPRQPPSFLPLSVVAFPPLAYSSGPVGPHHAHFPLQPAKKNIRAVYSPTSPSFLCPVLSQHQDSSLEPPPL
ncbi:hypothetical protein O6H91_09G040500 [Diphasiastrum complanatum]|uniref:Uncharacterized protein n=1 Tax=Diphasiastrum complanatum TaxID=34168 RepID=A0ACC2CNC4_DIPCM|nr:hypothetical protein O6H91_09G040500 [Diphasiastrum complanatum]